MPAAIKLRTPSSIVAFCYQIALLAGRSAVVQKMRAEPSTSSSTHRMSDTITMPQLCSGAVSYPASLVESRNHPTRNCLNKKGDVSRGSSYKICGRRSLPPQYPAYRFANSAYPKLSPRGAQDFPDAAQIAVAWMAIALTLGWSFDNLILQRSNDGKAAGSNCLPSVHLPATTVKEF